MPNIDFDCFTIAFFICVFTILYKPRLQSVRHIEVYEVRPAGQNNKNCLIRNYPRTSTFPSLHLMSFFHYNQVNVH